jgi:hypothetical protein
MNRCTFIQATILALTPHSITLSRAVPELGVGADSVLGFEYAVYALGSRMPEPLDLWDTSAASNTCTSHSDVPPHANANNAINGHAKQAVMHAPYGGTKAEGIAWLKRKQRIVEEAVSVLVVGGGALGIRECFFMFSCSCFRLPPFLLPICMSQLRLSPPAFRLPPFPNPEIHTDEAKTLILFSFCGRIRIRHRSRAPHEARHAPALAWKAVAAVRGFGGFGGWG